VTAAPDTELYRELYWTWINTTQNRNSGLTPSQADAITRLTTTEEMRAVWNTLFDWIKESGHLNSGGILGVTDAVASLAIRHAAGTQDISVIPESKRKDLASKISKHAKLLRRSLIDLGMPRNVFWYAGRKRTRDLIESLVGNVVFENRQTVIGDLISKFVDEHEDAPAIKSALEQTYKSEAVSRSGAEAKNYSDTYTEIDLFDILERLSTEEPTLEVLPPVVVQRSKFDNANRLALIRSFSGWMKDAFSKDPKEHRELIATYVRTVLDDPDNPTTEDTVKDALRNFSLGNIDKK